MNSVGTRYTLFVRGSECVIDQVSDDDFVLSVSGKKRGVFSTPDAARQKIISVISETTGCDEVEARAEVPLISTWAVETTAPFQPEDE